MISNLIGELIALAPARAGAIVGVADFNLQGVKEVVQPIRKSGGAAFYMAMDITNGGSVNEGIDQVVAQPGALNVLVANASVQILDPLESNSFSDWRKMSATHVEGASLTTCAALKHM